MPAYEFSLFANHSGLFSWVFMADTDVFCSSQTYRDTTSLCLWSKCSVLLITVYVHNFWTSGKKHKQSEVYISYVVLNQLSQQFAVYEMILIDIHIQPDN